MLFPTPSKTPKYRQPSSPSQAMLATVAKERPDGFLSRSHDLLPRELPEELRGALRQREMQRDPEPCSFGVGLGGVAWAAVGCHVYAWNADRPLDGCVRVVGNSEADAALVCAVRWSRPEQLALLVCWPASGRLVTLHSLEELLKPPTSGSAAALPRFASAAALCECTLPPPAAGEAAAPVQLQAVPGKLVDDGSATTAALLTTTGSRVYALRATMAAQRSLAAHPLPRVSRWSRLTSVIGWGAPPPPPVARVSLAGDDAFLLCAAAPADDAAAADGGGASLEVWRRARVGGDYSHVGSYPIEDVLAAAAASVGVAASRDTELRAVDVHAVPVGGGGATRQLLLLVAARGGGDDAYDLCVHAVRLTPTPTLDGGARGVLLPRAVPCANGEDEGDADAALAGVRLAAARRAARDGAGAQAGPVVVVGAPQLWALASADGATECTLLCTAGAADASALLSPGHVPGMAPAPRALLGPLVGAIAGGADEGGVVLLLKRDAGPAAAFEALRMGCAPADGDGEPRRASRLAAAAAADDDMGGGEGVSEAELAAWVGEWTARQQQAAGSGEAFAPEPQWERRLAAAPRRQLEGAVLAVGRRLVGAPAEAAWAGGGAHRGALSEGQLHAKLAAHASLVDFCTTTRAGSTTLLGGRPAVLAALLGPGEALAAAAALRALQNRPATEGAATELSEVAEALLAAAASAEGGAAGQGHGCVAALESLAKLGAAAAEEVERGVRLGRLGVAAAAAAEVVRAAVAYREPRLPPADAAAAPLPWSASHDATRALERLASTVADTVRAEDASGGPSAEAAALLARLHDLRSHQLSGELQRVHAGAGDASTFVGSRDRAASQLLQLGALAPAAALAEAFHEYTVLAKLCRPDLAVEAGGAPSLGAADAEALQWRLLRKYVAAAPPEPPLYDGEEAAADAFPRALCAAYCAGGARAQRELLRLPEAAAAAAAGWGGGGGGGEALRVKLSVALATFLRDSPTHKPLAWVRLVGEGRHGAAAATLYEHALEEGRPAATREAALALGKLAHLAHALPAGGGVGGDAAALEALPPIEGVRAPAAEAAAGALRGSQDDTLAVRLSDVADEHHCARVQAAYAPAAAGVGELVATLLDLAAQAAATGAVTVDGKTVDADAASFGRLALDVADNTAWRHPPAPNGTPNPQQRRRVVAILASLMEASAVAAMGGEGGGGGGGAWVKWWKASAAEWKTLATRGTERERYARLADLALFDALVYQELRERPGARLTVGERGLLPELLAYAADGALNFADMGRLLRDAQDGAVQLVDEVRRRGLLAELARRPDGLSAKGALAILDDASAAAPAESSGFELVPSAIAMDVA